MNFLSRWFSKKNKSSVPEWAGFFTPPQYTHFLTMVESELSSRAMRFEINDGVVAVLAADGEPQSYGLQNLAQLCNQLPPSEWGSAVAQHFNTLLNSKREREELEAQIDDFNAVRKYLKVRLFPEELHEGARNASVMKPLAPGILASLVWDLSSSVVSVSRDEAARWGMDEEELFSIALENVRAADPVSRETFNVGGNQALHALVGDSFFSATHVMLLGEILDPPTENGALVIIPNRHNVIYHPIRDVSAISAVQTLIVLALRMHKDGPGSISPYLYWWRDGQLTELPANVKGNTIEFCPPEDFTCLLNELCQEQSQGVGE